MGLIVDNTAQPTAQELNHNYTVTEADHNNIIVFNSNTDVVCTIPNGLRIGFKCSVVQKGTGKVQFVTLNGNTDADVNGTKTTDKTPMAWSTAYILCTNKNEYVVNFSGIHQSNTTATNSTGDIITIVDATTNTTTFRYNKGYILKKIIALPANDTTISITEVTNTDYAPLGQNDIEEQYVGNFFGNVFELNAMCVQALYRDFEVTQSQAGGKIVFITQKIIDANLIPAPIEYTAAS